MFTYKPQNKSSTPYSRDLAEFMYEKKLFWYRELSDEDMSKEEVKQFVGERMVDILKDFRVTRDDALRLLNEICNPEKYGLDGNPRSYIETVLGTPKKDARPKTLVSLSPTKTPSKLSHAKSEKKTFLINPLLQSLLPRSRVLFPLQKSLLEVTSLRNHRFQKRPVPRFLLPQLRSPFPRFQ
jgi:hypothetical protein